MIIATYNIQPSGPVQIEPNRACMVMVFLEAGWSSIVPCLPGEDRRPAEQTLSECEKEIIMGAVISQKCVFDVNWRF